MKITTDIFQVGGSGLSDSSDASAYLVISGDEAALIDSGTGSGTNRIVSNIKKCGIELSSVKYLFLTHCHYDHTGGAEKIRELTGCRIVAHKLDAEYLERGDSNVTAASWYGTYINPLEIDIKVPGNSMDFTVGRLKLKFFHTPGHSPGSSVLTVLSDDKLVLFGQDVHGPLNDMLHSNRSDYEASLAFLLTLNADILCEGHFGIIKGKKQVADFIESYM